MKSKRLFKLTPYNEVDDIWILEEHKFWFFYKFVGTGTKIELIQFVAGVGGSIKNTDSQL